MFKEGAHLALAVFSGALKSLIRTFSFFTLTDSGDLGNVIGSVSQTFQQYSPPGKWIGFPIYFRERNDFLKVVKILGLTFLMQEQTSKDGKQRFSICSNWISLLDGLFTASVYSRRGRFVNSPISDKNNWASKSKFGYVKTALNVKI